MWGWHWQQFAVATCFVLRFISDAGEALEWFNETDVTEHDRRMTRILVPVGSAIGWLTMALVLHSGGFW